MCLWAGVPALACVYVRRPVHARDRVWVSNHVRVLRFYLCIFPCAGGYLGTRTCVWSWSRARTWVHVHVCVSGVEVCKLLAFFSFTCY